MRNRLVAVLLVSGLVAAGAAYAHEGATGVVKERMEMMKGIASAMKAMAPMMQGKAAYDPESVSKSAATIAGHAARIPEKFPPGSNQKPSEAKAEIWQDWDKFQADAEAMRAHAAALSAEAANGREAAVAQFAKVAETCKTCHRSFREKKQ